MYIYNISGRLAIVTRDGWGGEVAARNVPPPAVGGALLDPRLSMPLHVPYDLIGYNSAPCCFNHNRIQKLTPPPAFGATVCARTGGVSFRSRPCCPWPAGHGKALPPMGQWRRREDAAAVRGRGGAGSFAAHDTLPTHFIEPMPTYTRRISPCPL